MVSSKLCEKCHYNTTKLSIKYPELRGFYRHFSHHCEDCLSSTLEETIYGVKNTDCCGNMEKIQTQYGKVCKNCGLVSSDEKNMVHYTTFDDSGNFSNSINMTDHVMEESKLGTKIAVSSNVNIKLKFKTAAYSITKDRKTKIVDEIRNICDTTDLDISKNIIDYTMFLFLDICGINANTPSQSKNIFKGKRRKAMKAVCVWLSFIHFNLPRSYIELSEKFGITKNIFIKELERYNDIKGTNYTVVYMYPITTIYLEEIKKAIDTESMKMCLSFKGEKILNKFIAYVSYNRCIRHTEESLIKICIYFFIKTYFEETSTPLNLKLLSNILKMNKFTLESNSKALVEAKDTIFSGIKKELIKDIFIKRRQGTN
jgi:hypothetical protein